MNTKLSRIIFIAICLSISSSVLASTLLLKQNEVQILLASNEPLSVQIAAKNLKRDIQKVLGSSVFNASSSKKGNKTVQLIIVNSQTNSVLAKKLKPLDGYEAHRVYADSINRRIYIHGADDRGAIYAIYSFCEQILGVPPLWFFSSWQPQKKKEITVSSNYEYYAKSPQVRYRAWFPNDQDLLNPWEDLSDSNMEYWLEAMMRLKLNSVELEGTVRSPYKLASHAIKTSDYGFTTSSHHFVALNSTYRYWEEYWTKMRKMDKAPELLLSNEAQLEEFWRYCAEVVHRNKINNLWSISFRGNGDCAFWDTFKDAPKDDKQRGKVISKMLKKQLDIIKEVTGEKEPYVRITFYDEMSDLLALKYVNPPAGENIIWTYVAARRDHYPNDDIVTFDFTNKVKLGYYMNLQFTSTGAHLAQAEGPWKMEFNYRYVNAKAPLYFSVVNAGNIREFLFTMSANAKMMWDFSAYNTDAFVLDFCKMYYGANQAKEIAQLYRSYFYSFWQQKKSEFPGMERQFIFQDLRCGRIIKTLCEDFFNYKPNPFADYASERVSGRTYRIVPEDNNAANEVDAVLNGMLATAPKFEEVAKSCSTIMPLLDNDKQTFFNDDLRSKAYFMSHLSKAVYHTVFAYKNQADKTLLINNLDIAIKELKTAQQHLYEAQHPPFESWYKGDEEAGKFNIQKTLGKLEQVKKIAQLNN